MKELAFHSFFSAVVGFNRLPVYHVYEFVGKNEAVPTLDSIITQYDVAVTCKMDEIEWRTNPSGARERICHKWSDPDSLEPETVENIRELIGMDPYMSTEKIKLALYQGNMFFMNQEDEYVNEPLVGIW